MAAGRGRRVRVPDATAPADLPSLVMIEVVGVNDRRHPGTLDESHQLGEPGDVRGIVSAWHGTVRLVSREGEVGQDRRS